MCKTTGVLLLLALSLLALSASAARAEWVVDAEGKCVRSWTPASLARGPTAESVWDVEDDELLAAVRRHLAQARIGAAAAHS